MSSTKKYEYLRPATQWPDPDTMHKPGMLPTMLQKLCKKASRALREKWHMVTVYRKGCTISEQELLRRCS